MRSAARILARIVVGLVAFVLILVGVGFAVVQTGWAKNQIRQLIGDYVTETKRQLNEFMSFRNTAPGPASAR